MAIGYINDAKEQAETYQPLLLCEFTFRSGNVLRVSTHPLSATFWGTPTAGSYEYGGHPWDPRVLNQDLGPTQAMSDLGVDIPPSASIVLADPDKKIFRDWELAEGFKGAVLRLYSVMWDMGNTATGSFSSDSPAPVKFVGTCSSPAYDDRSITIQAVSLLNMSSMQMPPVRVQPLCGWSFPTNAADRLDGYRGGDSRFRECGYSPDVSPYGVGNFQSGTACFTSCDYSFNACVARLGNSGGIVPIEKDTHGNFTGRFGGFQFIPNQNSGMQRPYLTGKWEEIVNATNESRYGDFVPMCYGTTWLEPLVMGVYGDGNYSNFEVLLCYGTVFEILKVVVNGTEVQHYVGGPPYTGDTDTGHRDSTNQIFSPSQTTEWKNNQWKTVNRGGLDGVPNPNSGWGRKGDPYGSIACIHIQCLRQLAPESAIPQIQILIRAGAVRTYYTSHVDPSGFGHFDNDVLGATNPAWVLMDLLMWANWRYDDMDIQSFLDAATKCDEQIYFTRMDGTYSNVFKDTGSPIYQRYSIGFCIRQRVSIGELIRGVRNAMKANLYFDYLTGKLKIIIKETVASQQPNAIPGSNYNDAVPSVTVAGLVANGHVAYSFDHTNIIKTPDGKSTLQVSQKTNQDSPNKVSVSFQNRENSYSQDSATIVDAEDVSRLGQEIFGSFPVYGPQTFDHIRRVVNTWFAENYRGNSRPDYEGSYIGDTGGTMMFDLQTTIKGIHLVVGQICFITDQQHGIDHWLARIVKIQPSMNFETARVTLQYHNDNWYQNTFGQVNQPKYGRPRSVIDRAPFPWRPYGDQPDLGDVYNDQTEFGFFLGPQYQGRSGSDFLSFAVVDGMLPCNTFPDSPGRPKLELVGSAFVSGAGGYDSGKSYYVAVSSKAGTGSFGSNDVPRCSFISKTAVVKCDAPNDSLSVTVQDWPDTPQGFYLFVGTAPNTMTWQYDGTGTPAGLNITASFKHASWGCPDQAFSMLRVRSRSVPYPGVWSTRGLTGSWSNGTTAIKMAVWDGTGFTTNEWAGRELSYSGQEVPPESGTGGAPVGNYEVLGNTSDTVYVKSDSLYLINGLQSAIEPSMPGDPTVLGPSAYFDNMFTMRILPIFGSDSKGNYFEDAKFVNKLNTIFSPSPITAASNNTPIRITVSDSAGFLPGDIAIVQGVEGNTAANGRWVVTNISTRSFDLVGSSGNGDYTGEGIVFKQVQGFGDQELVGKSVFVIAGSGRGTSVPIKESTQYRVYIEGDWPAPPDATTRIIIANSTYLSDLETPPLTISAPSFFSMSSQMRVDTSKFRKNQSLLFQVATVSTNGMQSLQVQDPFREMFLFNRYVFDGSITLHVPGVLAIGTNLATLISPTKDCYPARFAVQIKAQPGGAAIYINIRSGGTLIATLPIGDAGFIMEADFNFTFNYDPGGSALTPSGLDQWAAYFPRWCVLMAGKPVTLDITSVGTAYPGSDLTVTIYYNYNN